MFYKKFTIINIFIILSLSLTVSYFMFSDDKDYISIKSFDNLSSIKINSHVFETIDYINDNKEVIFEVSNEEDFINLIKSKDYYLGIYEYKDDISILNHIDIYILKTNNYLYYIEKLKDNKFTLKNMIIEVNIENTSYIAPIFIKLPLTIDQELDINLSDITHINSLKEVVNFYENFNEDIYYYDEVNNVVEVYLYKENEVSKYTLYIRERLDKLIFSINYSY